MKIPDSPIYQDLKQFHKPDNLAFRAACNAVLSTSGKPLRKRAIELIHESDDSHEILTRLWNTHGPVAPHVMATNLAQDLCWKTLVQEKVAHESSWRDLFQTIESDKLFDSAKSFCQKLWDGQSHPATKAAATIVLTIAGYGAAKTLAPQALAIPFTPVWNDKTNLPIRFTAESDAKLPPLQVRVLPPENGVQIPVDLQINGQGKSIGIGLAGTEAQGEALQNIAVQLAATNKALANTSVVLQQASAKSFKLDSGALAESVEHVSANTHSLSVELPCLTQQVRFLEASLKEALIEQDKGAAKHFETMSDRLLAVSQAAQHPVLSIVLQKGKPQSVALPFPDGKSGGISSKTVEIQFVRTARDEKGSFVELKWKSEGLADYSPLKLYDGISADFLAQPLYRVSLNALSRTWLGGKQAKITLTPQAANTTSKFADAAAVGNAATAMPSGTVKEVKHEQTGGMSNCSQRVSVDAEIAVQ